MEDVVAGENVLGAFDLVGNIALAIRTHHLARCYIVGVEPLDRPWLTERVTVDPSVAIAAEALGYFHELAQLECSVQLGRDATDTPNAWVIGDFQRSVGCVAV